MAAAISRHRTLSQSSASRLAWAIAGLTFASVAATAGLAYANRAAISTLDQASPIEIGVPLGITAAGALIATRRRDSPIGWILLATAFITALSGTSAQFAVLGTKTGTPESVHGWAAWLWSLSSILVFPAGLVILLILLFPDGRLPSPRWRWVVWLGAALTAYSVAINILGTQRITPVTGLGSVANPTALDGWRVDPMGLLAAIGWLGGVVVLCTASTSLVVRLRRARGEAREQLKWFVAAVVATVAVLLALIVAALLGWEAPDAVFSLVIVAGFGVGLPVACGIAILKHGLYEIDVVIRRTVVYAAIAAFTTGVYLAVVLGAGAVVGRNSSFLTMLAAVVVAVSFQPVYRRASRFADRVAYGERATPYEVLSEFSERLGGTYASDDLMSRMARIVAEGTGAEAADVWLKIGDELRVAASWPATDRRVDAIAVSNGALPDLPECDRAFPVEQAGELLGALSVRKRPADPLRPAEEKLVSDLASQAGLVLRNERLTTELRARLDDLRAAQKRIVAAQDEERRRLERNIHDGAQQQLVAIAVRMRLAQGLVESDPAAAAGVLEQLQRETQGALETLRDLARGIYPPLLADRGLVAALTAQAQKAPIDVDVDADGVGRYAQDVEAAAYFCCLEALQNVAKYAEAPRASVRLRGDHASLEFVVADRGVGFDPSVASSGSGLQGMADRLAALDGTLQVSSSPGAGTVVTGRIPAASASNAAAPS